MRQLLMCGVIVVLPPAVIAQDVPEGELTEEVPFSLPRTLERGPVGSSDSGIIFANNNAVILA